MLKPWDKKTSSGFVKNPGFPEMAMAKKQVGGNELGQTAIGSKPGDEVEFVVQEGSEEPSSAKPQMTV